MSQPMRAVDIAAEALAAAVRRAIEPKPNRCADCLCDLAQGNRCEDCEKAHRCFTSERGRELHFFTEDLRGSLFRSERQFHGDHYQA